MRGKVDKVWDAGDGPVCAHPECNLRAEYRAPVSRSHLRQYQFFCLEHVREYNAAWDYCAGMSPRDLEEQIRKDAVWGRPTWPGTPRQPKDFEDPFNLYVGSRQSSERQAPSITGPERQALSTLGLEHSASSKEIKDRYKFLAKSLHPDANGSDKRAEERLKSVNHAYTTLRCCDRVR